jgi:hypothetical protein
MLEPHGPTDGALVRFGSQASDTGTKHVKFGGGDVDDEPSEKGDKSLDMVAKMSAGIGNDRLSTADYQPMEIDTWQGDELIPLEWTWTVMRRLQLERHSKKLAAHVVFAVLFVVIFSLMRPVEDTAALHQALVELTAGAPSTGHRASWERTFKSVSSDKEWWAWVETALLPTILSDTFYNGDFRNETWDQRFSNTVAMYNTQTATVRFRQARVKANSCYRLGDHDLARPCFGDFTPEIQESAPFGESYGNKYVTGLGAISSFRDFGPNYGTEGYVVDLPLNKDQAMAQAREMKLGGWLSEATSIVAIETSWYNANLDLSTSVRWQLDISPGGRMDPWVTVESCRLIPYAIVTDYARAGLEAILAWSLLLLISEAAYRIRSQPRVFFSSVWNWIEVLTHLLYMGVLASWFSYWFRDKTPYQVVSTETHEGRPDLSTMTKHFNITANLAACAIVLSFLLTFRYLQAFRAFGRLWCTLGHSMGDLAPFLLVFGIFIAGFSVAGHWIFGSQLQPFNTYIRAFTTLFLSLVGGFPYDTMRKVAPVSALVFSTAWIVVVVFVLANVFIAIMTEWYRQVNEEERHIEKKIAEHVTKAALEVLSKNAIQIGLRKLYGRVRSNVDTELEKLLGECAVALKDADLGDLEHMRLALIGGKNVDVRALTVHWSARVNENSLKQAYEVVDKIQQTKDAAQEVEEAAGEVQDEDQGGSAENEAQEQEELRSIQSTVQRLEAQLKELRAALRQSSKAPLLEGQSPEGYVVNPAPTFDVPPAPDSTKVSAAAISDAQGLVPPLIPGAVPEHSGLPPAGGGIGGF